MKAEATLSNSIESGFHIKKSDFLPLSTLRRLLEISVRANNRNCVSGSAVFSARTTHLLHFRLPFTFMIKMLLGSFFLAIFFYWNCGEWSWSERKINPVRLSLNDSFNWCCLLRFHHIMTKQIIEAIEGETTINSRYLHSIFTQKHNIYACEIAVFVITLVCI